MPTWGNQYSTGGIVTVAIYTTPVTRDWAWQKIDRGPVWGWWAGFYPVARVLLPTPQWLPCRPLRSQARGCIKTVRRWKRRRFVQKLRRRA